MKTCPVGVELFHEDTWIDRQMGKWTDKHRQTDSYAEANIQFLHCILNKPKEYLVINKYINKQTNKRTVTTHHHKQRTHHSANLNIHTYIKTKIQIYILQSTVIWNHKFVLLSWTQITYQYREDSNHNCQISMFSRRTGWLQKVWIQYQMASQYWPWIFIFVYKSWSKQEVQKLCEPRTRWHFLGVPSLMKFVG